MLVGFYFGAKSTNAVLLAHEYFHLLQQMLSDGSSIVAPRWLLEGSATYEGQLYIGLLEGIRPGSVAHAANCEGELRDFESFESPSFEAQCGYILGALASEWLAEHAGANSHVRYWELLRRSRTWEDAFASAFGIAPDEFYEAFEQDLGESVSELPIGRIEGIVLGPDGEALQGIGLTLLSPSFASSTETSRVGTFGLHARIETYTIKVHAKVPGEVWTWRHVGWYGEGGFTTDRSKAIAIEVAAGADVTGIEIRLPANPADLPTIE